MTGRGPASAEKGKTRFGSFLACVCDSARLMVGMPDYETYVAHIAATHPDQAPMSREAFFQNRLEARYGGGSGKGGFRCC